jgi:hypothetical protein
MKMLTPSLAACLFFAATVQAAEPKEPVELDQLLSRSQLSTNDWAHIDGSVLLKGNQPICAYGVRQIGEGKPEYTFFVLFKRLPKAQDFSVSGPGRSSNNKSNYTVTITVDKKKIDITHRQELDKETKKLSVDELQVGDEKIKPGASRVFVVDLAAEPPAVKTLDIKPPAQVIDPRSDKGQLDTIMKIAAEYVAETKELKELFPAGGK